MTFTVVPFELIVPWSVIGNVSVRGSNAEALEYWIGPDT
jgi:hypothetical protein